MLTVEPLSYKKLVLEWARNTAMKSARAGGYLFLGHTKSTKLAMMRKAQMQSGPCYNNSIIMMMDPCCLQQGAYCPKRIVVPFIQAQILSNLYNIGRNWSKLNKYGHNVKC